MCLKQFNKKNYTWFDLNPWSKEFSLQFDTKNAISLWCFQSDEIQKRKKTKSGLKEIVEINLLQN